MKLGLDKIRKKLSKTFNEFAASDTGFASMRLAPLAAAIGGSVLAIVFAGCTEPSNIDAAIGGGVGVDPTETAIGTGTGTGTGIVERVPDVAGSSATTIHNACVDRVDSVSVPFNGVEEGLRIDIEPGTSGNQYNDVVFCKADANEKLGEAAKKVAASMGR